MCTCSLDLALSQKTSRLRTLSRLPSVMLGAQKTRYIGEAIMLGAQKTRYIGEAITLATEFHDSDFSWDDHAKACEPIIKERQGERQVVVIDGPEGCTSSGNRALTRLPQEAAGTSDREPWERFFSNDAATNRFYKQRRYLLLEFPILQQIASMNGGHVFEIGAGGGGSLRPILAFNQNARATASDISQTSLSQLKRAAEETVEGSRNIDCFVCDSADPSLVDRFKDLAADVCLLMYTLSAVPPPLCASSSVLDDLGSGRGYQRGQEAMLAQAFRSLRPGGRLVIRDHGLYDLVQMRIPSSQFIGPGHTYIRGDGTQASQLALTKGGGHDRYSKLLTHPQAHFFSTSELKVLGESIGFKAEEVRYVTVVNRNKKTGAEMKRVFVYAVHKSS